MHDSLSLAHFNIGALLYERETIINTISLRVRVRVRVWFIETKFYEIASSDSKTLFSVMNVTMIININREIQITVTIFTLALVSVCRNTYYSIITLISLFCLFRCNHVPRFFHQICPFFYSCSNTSEILELCSCLHFSSYYKYTSTNMKYIVVLIGIFTRERTGD